MFIDMYRNFYKNPSVDPQYSKFPFNSHYLVSGVRFCGIMKYLFAYGKLCMKISEMKKLYALPWENEGLIFCVVLMRRIFWNLN